ncbi:beta-lactamase/transpeptidase-like protein [Mycena metata]|uniref:Beta-lactamase/transpeptidase-like protein n=1 Tax=Mycena metata TaxID=1033252 RepID=A0AAD7JRM8_9AGAR|nr:beta-lactamase/transpeptidase-like protein [Mycena metata]
MYITGAYVVSKYSGSSYRDFVEERIFRPLGMKSSTLYPDRAFETGKLTQSFTPSRRRIPFFMPEETADLIAGAGGVMSTAEDMTLWVKLLLNAGVDAPTNATIIPRTTFDLATSGLSITAAQGDESRSIMGYGLGWLRLSSYGHEVVIHNGGAAGVSTFVVLYPRDGFGIVLLANTQDLPTIGLALNGCPRPRSSRSGLRIPRRNDAKASDRSRFSCTIGTASRPRRHLLERRLRQSHTL